MKALKACSLFFAFAIVLIPAPSDAQWTEPVRIGIPGAYLYPQILAAGDTLHVVGTLLPGGDKVVYLRSDDGGDSWSQGQILSDTLNSTNAIFVRIVRNGPNIMVLWRSIMNQGVRPWNIGYALSADNGETWTEPLYVLDPGWDHILYFSASGSGPVLNVIVSSRIDHNLVFFNIRSTNFGQSWSEPVELFRAAQGGRPDQTSNGNIIHYAWSGRYTMDDKMEIFYMRSLDDGISWSPSSALSDSDQYHSQLPAIAADDSGNVGAIWMDFKYAPPGATGDIFIRQSADSGSYWTAEDHLTSDHYAYRSDIVSDADSIHVAWEDWSHSPSRRQIHYRRSMDNGASWSEPYWVDGTDDDSWNPALAASNGRVYIVWADGRDDPGIGLYFCRYEEETAVIDDSPITPTITALRAYPNPFNSNVNISLNIEKGGDTEIAIYDVKGRLVKKLFEGGNLERGWHKFTWDAADAYGEAVSSGLYFAVASTPQGKLSKTLTLIR